MFSMRDSWQGLPSSTITWQKFEAHNLIVQGITLDKLLIKLTSFYTSGLKPFSKCNKVAYNSTAEASDYEIGKGLRDQLLFPFQFIKKPAKWNNGKVTNRSKCTSYLCASTLYNGDTWVICRLYLLHVHVQYRWICFAWDWGPSCCNCLLNIHVDVQCMTTTNSQHFEGESFMVGAGGWTCHLFPKE